MNGNNSKPFAILVFGVPMSGKTQFASKFSRQFKAPFLNFDAIPDISHETFLAVVSQIADSQQNIVIEGGIDTFEQREKLREILRNAGYRPVLLWIQTDVNIVKRRLKTSMKSVEKAKTFFEKRLQELEAPEDTENPIVVSGKHTFEGQLKSVLLCLSKI